MPKGSPQRLLTEVLAEQTLVQPAKDCPPIQNLRGVQALCENYSGPDLLAYMQRLDGILFTFSTYPETLPQLGDLELEPRTDYWLYLPEYGRFERSFDFEGGSYRIIYVPFNELSSNLTILYIPGPTPEVKVRGALPSS